ncbi:hypothetical protein GCM10009727_29120 [Actinomadura napierensis]|uniref:Uncharacterized protein n=1 Tax=Actinomadura napierensis TaxID=267854 RepID=A0ABP5KT43_9ACTN
MVPVSVTGPPPAAGAHRNFAAPPVMVPLRNALNWDIRSQRPVPRLPSRHAPRRARRRLPPDAPVLRRTPPCVQDKELDVLTFHYF